MSNTTVGASVEIEYKSIGELRKAIKEATSDLIVLQERFGVTSKEAMAAADKVAQLKDRIQDAKEQADLFDPGKKFQALSTAARTIATGFSAVQGAMTLLGAESEDLQRSLLKVQGALALSQSLNELGELQKSFDILKQGAVRAFTAIKGAIGSSGIGLLVIAIAAIAANWDRIKGAVSGVTSAQRKLNEETQKNLKAQQQKLETIDLQENTLRLQGKTEKEILALKIKQTNDTILAAQAAVKNARITRDAQVNAAKRNRDILAGIINFLSAPLTLILKTVGKIGEFLGKDWTFNLGESLATMIFDPAEVQSEGDQALAAAENTLAQLISKRDGYQIQINNIDKKANEKSAKDNAAHNDKINKDDDSARKAALEAQKRAEEELERQRKNAEEKELFDLKLKYEEQKKIIQDGNGDVTALDKVYELQRQEIKDKYKKLEDEANEKRRKALLELEKASQQQLIKSELDTALEGLRDNQKKRREEYIKEYGQTQEVLNALTKAEIAEEEKLREEFRQKEIQKNADSLLEKSRNDQLSFDERLKAVADREKLVSQIVFANDKARTDFEEQNSKARKAIIAAENQFRIDQAQKTADVLQGLSDVVGKETAAGKGLAVAAATINTYLAASKALAGISTANPLGAALAIGQAAIVIATGLKNVREILKVKVPGGGGPGPAPTPPPPTTLAPLSPVLSPAIQGQALNAEAINNLGNQAMRAYVLNSDIQNNSQRNAYLQRNARIG